MRIDTIASVLVSQIEYLSKISRLNDNNKSILIRADDDIRLYASSSSVYGEANVAGRVQEQGSSLVPLTLIPYLRNYESTEISVRFSLNDIIVESGKDVLTLPQISGSLEDISVRSYSPNWLGINIPRIKNMRYAANEADLKMDNFWFIDNTIVASDRIRICVYRPGYESDIVTTIPSFITSYMPQVKDDETVDLALDKDIWIGNKDKSISIQKWGDDTIIPQPILELARLNEIENFVVISRREFQRRIKLAKMILDKDKTRIGINMMVRSDEVEFSPQQGSDFFVPVVDNVLNDGDFSLKLNCRLLLEAVDNCVNTNLMVGLTQLGPTPLFFIVDYDMIHYLIPLRN